MFLWWRDLTGRPDTSPEESQAQALAVTEETTQEIADLTEMLGATGLKRPSTVSKSKYNKWAVAEYNRHVGEEARQGWDRMDHQRQQDRANFLESGHERAAAARAQREAAAERVRQFKEDVSVVGQQGRDELLEYKQAAESMRQAALNEGVRLAQLYGAEQKEKVLESRNERYEDNRNAANAYKDGEVERAAIYAAAAERELQEKRERVARIRAETHPEVVRQSKDHFYSVRKSAADDVRASVKDWSQEASYKNDQTLARAKENRDAAERTKKQAADGQEILRRQRAAEADAIRQGVRAIGDKKEHDKLSDLLNKRDEHDKCFESKYVTQPEAESVVTSNYDELANRHQQELKQATPGKVIPRGDWFPIFNGLGWFGDVKQ